jgi:tripartite-type tricarboxylate transporter receptor subunit TctC
MTRTRRDFIQTLGAGAVLGAAGLSGRGAFAQANWPNKTIRVIVPYTAGGFTDITARLVTQKLEERLGQSIVVDNKPGANSIIGVGDLARSKPDGNTFAVVIAAFAANTTLYEKLPYDPKKDIEAVSLIGISPLVAAVNNNAPFKNAKELVEYAKANPGKISFASSGKGAAAHLTTELLKEVAGIDMVHVPYKGAAPALTDLMGGHVGLFFDAAVGLIEPGKTGRVRLIGVASDERLTVLPDLPTFKEQGIENFTGSTWAGMLAPAGVPREIVQRMSSEISEIVKMPDVRERLEQMGTIPVGSKPEEFARFIDDETKKWGDVIRTAKVTVD